MRKRKIYSKTDIHGLQVEGLFDQNSNIVATCNAIPPPYTLVIFGRNATSRRSFDFARWYGVNIDSVTFACQRQIERFVIGQDSEVEISTICSYCHNGLQSFLDFLLQYASALQKEILLSDINREIIDGYLHHLRNQGLSIITQKVRYSNAKSVLQALGHRKLFILQTSGDAATFPRNPFPNSNRQSKGETPLPKKQRQAFAYAIKHAVMPIWRDDIPLTSDLLVYALLIVALHTGRNTTPLLEMGRDCLHRHPKDDSTFLILWKRRGHNNSKVILRADSVHERRLESMPTVKSSVERLIQRIITRTAPLLPTAPIPLQSRVWLYRPSQNEGQVNTLTQHRLSCCIKKLIIDYSLTDSDGKPMRINISRLRKTFSNRIFELLDGDLATTAIALGNSTQVAGRNYLTPNEDSKRNWRFMGEILVKELLSHTIGATYKTTPLGRCGDPVNGQYAPKKEGATCVNFLNCVRCQHYVITADDLYKLYSFYFRVFAERKNMDKQRWARDFAHIPRLIDKYIVAEGLRRGYFKPSSVNAAREQARAKPDLFWSSDMITNIAEFR